jgi:BMFP domain-containing protein YqiC
MTRVATSVPGRIGLRFACAVVCALAASGAGAQRVYKCTSGSSVSYSHVPCFDAQVVDVVPTQGMDRASGISRKGADVQRTEHRAMLAHALKPLNGMDEKQFDQFSDRQRLDPQAREACDQLDARLAQQEAQAAQPGTDAERKAYATLLFESRQRHRRLRC